MEKKGAFLLIAAFALFFGVLFLVIDSEAGGPVFLAMLGLIGLVGFVWQFTAWLTRQQNRTGVREVHIARDGVYMNRRLSTWRSWGGRLLDVKLERKRSGHRLVFQYTMLTWPPQTFVVRVPVPEGQEETARQIQTQLSQPS